MSHQPSDSLSPSMHSQRAALKHLLGEPRMIRIGLLVFVGYYLGARIGSASNLGLLAAELRAARGALADAAAHLVVRVACGFPCALDRRTAVSGSSGHGCLLVH